MAQKANREKVEFADIKRAIQESVIPSDRAHAEALQGQGKRSASQGNRRSVSNNGSSRKVSRSGPLDRKGEAALVS